MDQPFLLETPSSSASMTPTMPGFFLSLPFLPLTPVEQFPFSTIPTSSFPSQHAAATSSRFTFPATFSPVMAAQVSFWEVPLLSHWGSIRGVPFAFPLTFQRPKLKPLSASHLATSSPLASSGPLSSGVPVPSPSPGTLANQGGRHAPLQRALCPFLEGSRRCADTCLWVGGGICILPLLSRLYESRPPNSSLAFQNSRSLLKRWSLCKSLPALQCSFQGSALCHFQKSVQIVPFRVLLCGRKGWPSL